MTLDPGTLLTSYQYPHTESITNISVVVPFPRVSPLPRRCCLFVFSSAVTVGRRLATAWLGSMSARTWIWSLLASVIVESWKAF